MLVPEPLMAGSGGITALGHEPLDDTMKHNAVIEAFAGQLLDARDVIWGKVGTHSDDDLSVFQIHQQRVLWILNGGL